MQSIKRLGTEKGSSRTLMIAAVFAIVVVSFLVWQFYLAPKPEGPRQNGKPTDNQTTVAPEIPDFQITVIGLDGEECIIGPEDIAGLTTIELDGGLKTSAGSIRSVGTYTAVPVSEVCDLVGGISSENSLRVTAADDYAMIYTWEDLEGGFVTYDPATGDEVASSSPLLPVLTYFCNGEPLYPNEGPIRLTIVGEEGLITEGHYWVKQVVKIEILPAVMDWTLSLEGAMSEEIDRATFESAVNCPDTLPNHKGVYEDSDGRIWTGIPVWLLVGRVDDEVHHEENAYNRDLADANAYTVKFIAGDGYSVELNSTFVKLNENIILANEVDGAPLEEPYWPLRLVGTDLNKGQMVRNIVKMELVFSGNVTEEEPVVEWGPDWNLTLSGAITEVMNRKTYMDGAECEYANHSNTWTDDEGQVWGGIPLWYLVGRVDDGVDHGPGAFNETLAEQGYTVRLIASDGFSKDFDSATVKHNDNIILAYTMDGGPLPEKYLPLRIVGPGLTKSEMIRNVVEIQIIYPG